MKPKTRRRLEAAFFFIAIIYAIGLNGAVLMTVDHSGPVELNRFITDVIQLVKSAHPESPFNRSQNELNALRNCIEEDHMVRLSASVCFASGWLSLLSFFLALRLAKDPTIYLIGILTAECVLTGGLSMWPLFSSMRNKACQAPVTAIELADPSVYAAVFAIRSIINNACNYVEMRNGASVLRRMLDRYGPVKFVFAARKYVVKDVFFRDPAVSDDVAAFACKQYGAAMYAKLDGGQPMEGLQFAGSTVGLGLLMFCIGFILSGQCSLANDDDKSKSSASLPSSHSQARVDMPTLANDNGCRSQSVNGEHQAAVAVDDSSEQSTVDGDVGEESTSSCDTNHPAEETEATYSASIELPARHANMTVNNEILSII